MDEKNFKQGMKHDEALSMNLGVKSLNGKAAETEFVASYNSLPSRPDYDGRLTLEEANLWYRQVMVSLCMWI